jgi:hypothetical protein
MKYGKISTIACALALSAASTANAHPNVSIAINPFGFGVYAPPPVVYQPAPYYAPPPVVYLGGGSWGGHRGRDSREHRGGGRHR